MTRLEPLDVSEAPKLEKKRESCFLVGLVLHGTHKYSYMNQICHSYCFQFVRTFLVRDSLSISTFIVASSVLCASA